MRTFWSQLHLRFLPIFIISLIFLHFASHPVKGEWGMDCNEPEMFISNGRIIVVETIDDFPTELLSQPNANIQIMLKEDDNDNNLGLTHNITPIDDDTVKITYTLSYAASLEVANRAEANNGDVDIDLRFIPSNDVCHSGPDLYLTNQDVAAIRNLDTINLPQAACGNGCPDNQVCTYNNAGNIDDPNNWSCQDVSLALVDVHGACGNKAIDTAIGCIPLETKSFTLTIITYAIGLAGFTALIIMLIGTTIILTGGSNPEQVKKGKEIFTSAIMGLLFIIFSAVILKIINQDVLGNPIKP